MQQQRKDEILAKKAKLAELKRQRELRQKEFSANRQSIGLPSTESPGRSRFENRQDIDNLISSLVGEERGPATPSPSSRNRSRPSSYASPSHTDADGATDGQPGVRIRGSGAPQDLSFASTYTVYELNADPPKREIVTYSKQTQTDAWLEEDSNSADQSDVEGREASADPSKPQNKAREEELRENLRREIEEELRALQQPQSAEAAAEALQKPKFPARALTTEELDAVTSSNDFLDFIDRSSKVIERALDEEYDVLADYRRGDYADSDDEAGPGGSKSKAKKGRRLRQVIQFWDERWSKKRMISDVNFSSKFPELALASYTKNPSAPYDPDGLVQVWNLHMHDRPEYIFQNTSDILTAKFSPFHPSLVFGGSYSGQVLLWDTRSRSPHPVQKTPLTGSGHTHPVYSLNIVGTQNAHNIISTSTDGVMCSWSVDMLSQPQEYLELTAPPVFPPSASSAAPAPLPYTHSSELAPTTTAFPMSDPTYLLAGTESGTIHLAHRYDRAGARAGVDTRVAYRGHQAPVMSLDFHRASGPVDLGDLLLSSSVDWSVKVWRVRTPASTSIAAAAAGGPSSGAPTTTTTSNTQVSTPSTESPMTLYEPALDMHRDDAIYDAKWSPVKAGVFACVDGAGALEIWDICADTEVPAAKAVPSARIIDGVRVPARALNKCAWETHEGKRIAVGGLDGVISIFEVGNELGGAESVRPEEWGVVKRLVTRNEGAKG